ncbi:MAG TPA: FG-GAP-like repeat-containing protein [Planctomycetota bacterium]|nr:FG-GAP-like repeat-containing protein [Planctomycetota bacterium]
MNKSAAIVVGLICISAGVYLIFKNSNAPDNKGGELPYHGAYARLPKNAPGSIHSVPLAAQEGSTGLMFEELSPAQTGIDFENKIDTNHPLKFLYHSGFGCGGVCVGDIDNDGLPDVLLLNGPGENKLYRNLGNFKFEDISAKAGIGGGDRWAVGAAMVDINNDGLLDIYICNYDAPNELYINNGDGTFTECAKKYGLDIVDASLVPAFCDYDGDGYLDLYLLTNRLHLPNGRPKDPPVVRDSKGNPVLDAQNKPTILPEYQRYFGLTRNGYDAKGRPNWDMDSIGTPDHLYHNNGNGTFTEVTEQAGIGGAGQGLSATWWDFDGDGLPDLYVANDFTGADKLYHNNGNGTFTDVINMMPHTSWFSMGSDFADIDNRGMFDFFVGDMSATTHYKNKTTMGAMGSNAWFLEHTQPPQYMRNALYINTGAGRFMEGAFWAGLANSDWTWSVKFGDLDNDGRVDLFVCNGMARNFNDSDIPFRRDMLIGQTEWNIYEKTAPRPEKCLAFHNRGGYQFDEVGAKWGLDHFGMNYAAAYADLNRDGNLDLIVTRLDEKVAIYRNRSVGGHRVEIQLEGVKSNKYGIGSLVRIETAAGKQMRMLTVTTGFLAENDSVIHFGLGKEEKLKTLSVEWPSGHVQKFENLDADRFYTITEPDTAPPPRAKPTAPPPAMFEKIDTVAFEKHKEIPVSRFSPGEDGSPFNEFKRPGQSLLPNSLAQLGPALAVADVDGDGLDDLLVTGAAGQACMLYLNKGNGKFERSPQPAFDADKASTSLGAVFFDSRGTGAMDLYVASGGVQCNPGDALLRGRLYYNDGKGHFTKAPLDALPDNRDSAGVVAAADFDRDGKVDLFVGGRLVIGAWPTTPNSHLLKNTGGKFVDVTDEVAPGLKNIGMVTGAVWSDVDGDGWLDLMLTIEWGTPRYFHNENGKLVDRTNEAGLSELTGWWNGIAAGDLNGDGHIDFVVTNFGTNHKYHASKEKPTQIFYGDFDGSGTKQIVEAEYEDDTLFPVRGRSCSSRAMPELKEKFKTYKDWAAAPLEKIYEKPKLETSMHLKATTLESGVLLNDGHGKFTYKPLPKLAQIFPAFGCAIVDVDGDGKPDIYLVGNFYGPQVETGHMDGGLSLLLRGNGDGTFTEVWPKESGFVVPGDAKSLVTLDLTGGGWPDFVIGKNDDALEIYRNTGSKTNHSFTVKLSGKAGNPAGIGARVTLTLDDDSTKVAEVYGGSGYLSQSSATLFFGIGAHSVKSVKVAWPGGLSSTMPPEAGANGVTVKYPVK